MAAVSAAASLLGSCRSVVRAQGMSATDTLNVAHGLGASPDFIHVVQRSGATVLGGPLVSSWDATSVSLLLGATQQGSFDILIERSHSLIK
jgi:hypothetical protein